MINIPCGNEPLTTPECSPDCDEAIRELRERVGEMTDKLNTIEEGAQVNPPIDNSMSNSSPNAVENQVITQYVNEYGIALGSDAPLVGGAIVGDAVLGGATSLVLERPDGTEDSVDIQGSGAVSVSAQNDVLTIDVPTGIIAQLEAGLDTTNRAWAADVLHDWLETRITQIPADQFLDLAKTTFVNPFTWSNVLYPGSINPNLDGKPVLVLALTDGTNTTYSFLNMEDLVHIKNIVDGNAASSLRQISAQSDNSSYTQGVASATFGIGTKASGVGAFAEGNGTTASGDYSHAEGGGAQAVGAGAHAEGGGTIASLQYAHAEGYYTQATKGNAHAEGERTLASDTNAHAEGYYTKATGTHSHAEGYQCEANGYVSHAQGIGTLADSPVQNVFGQYNISDTNNQYFEIVGNGTSNSTRSNVRTLDKTGNEILAGKLTVGVNPVDNMDVATKQYVDQHAGGGTSITVTLASANWNGNSQTVTATGVTASNTVIISPAPSNIDDYGDAGIYCSAQSSNSLTFACASTPSNNISVNILIM